MCHRFMFTVLGLACLMRPVIGRSAVTWERTEASVKCDLTDEVKTIEFAFRNSGGANVTITEIVPGCGCTTADLSKRTYAPGEAGRLTLTIRIGNHTGDVVKHTAIKVDDGTTTSLDVTLQIPVPATWAPAQFVLKGNHQPVEVRIRPIEGVKLLRGEVRAPAPAQQLAYDQRVQAFIVKLDPASVGSVGSGYVNVDLLIVTGGQDRSIAKTISIPFVVVPGGAPTEGEGR